MIKFKIEKTDLSGQITKRQKAWKVISIILCTGIIILISGMIVLWILINSYLKDLPEINVDDLKNVSQTSYIYDSKGNILTTYSDIENRTWVSIKDMPEDLLKAVVAVEDRRFYSHNGYDVKRIISAVFNFVTGQDIHGGSTLTQQVIKNTVLTNETTLKRKVQELFLASRLEEKMSKDEILEAYLNIIYLGGSNYGVAAAAKDYFDKEDLMTLTRKECAFLAGITQNPYYYNPRANYYSRDAFDRNEERTSTVVYAMQTAGYITEEEYYAIMDEEIVIKEISSSSNMYKYPHFIEYAITDVINGFLQYRGLEDTKENRSAIENEIRNGGYKIYTTIDTEIQENVQSSLSQFTNYPTFTKSESNPDISTEPQAAAVVINQKTGEIVAMVGSINEPTIKKSFNRAISNTMPIGSIIKPLSVYGPAIETGLSPATPVYNFPSKIDGYDDKIEYPGGGLSLSQIGIVSLRYSLEQSLNIPTARLLCSNVGFQKSTEYLSMLGIDRESISSTGSGLALGSSGVDMLEVTGAYAAIANGGVYNSPRAYTQVLDANGKVILNAESVKSSREVFTAQTSWLLTNMMEGVINSGTGTKAKLTNITAAGKTGTNEDNSLTFAGFTHYYTSALWVGNDSFLSFDESITSSAVAPLWKEYMDKIHNGYQDESILSYGPEECGLIKATVCNVSGKLPTEYCSHGTTEDWFTSETVPTEYCDMHVNIDLCQDSHGVATTNCLNRVKGTLTKLYIPEDSSLYNIEKEQVEKIFSECLWGEEELNNEINYNLCQLHSPAVDNQENSPAVDNQENSIADIDSSEITEFNE